VPIGEFLDAKTPRRAVRDVHASKHVGDVLSRERHVCGCVEAPVFDATLEDRFEQCRQASLQAGYRLEAVCAQVAIFTFNGEQSLGLARLGDVDPSMDERLQPRAGVAVLEGLVQVDELFHERYALSARGQLEEQLLLGAHVVVESRLQDPSPIGDLLH
jgi:hypothetical protein